MYTRIILIKHCICSELYKKLLIYDIRYKINMNTFTLHQIQRKVNPMNCNLYSMPTLRELKSYEHRRLHQYCWPHLLTNQNQCGWIMGVNGCSDWVVCPVTPRLSLVIYRGDKCGVLNEPYRVGSSQHNPDAYNGKGQNIHVYVGIWYTTGLNHTCVYHNTNKHAMTKMKLGISIMGQTYNYYI